MHLLDFSYVQHWQSCKGLYWYLTFMLFKWKPSQKASHISKYILTSFAFFNHEKEITTKKIASLLTLSSSLYLAQVVYSANWVCMMTSSNGKKIRVTGHLCGEFTGPRWIPRSKASEAVGVFFDLRPNKRLGKQWWGWLFEMPSSPLWRHCNGVYYHVKVWPCFRHYCIRGYGAMYHCASDRCLSLMKLTSFQRD